MQHIFALIYRTNKRLEALDSLQLAGDYRKIESRSSGRATFITTQTYGLLRLYVRTIIQVSLRKTPRKTSMSPVLYVKHQI